MRLDLRQRSRAALRFSAGLLLVAATGLPPQDANADPYTQPSHLAYNRVNSALTPDDAYSAHSVVSTKPSVLGESETRYLPGTGFVRKESDQGHRYRFIGHKLATAYSDRLRIGAEMELSKYETQLAGLPGIQVKSYNIRTLLQIIPFPDQFSPYCGAGLGVDVMRFDADQVESVITSYRVDKFGIAMGGVGFVGVQLPVATGVLLYAEGRAAGVFQVFSAADVEMGAGVYEGYGGIAGLRMSF